MPRDLSPLTGSARILDVIAGSNDQCRLVVVAEKTLCGHEHLVLRQETHQPGVGWFVQSQLPIEASQLDALKTVMGSSVVNRMKQTAAKNIERCNIDVEAEAERPSVIAFPVAG